MVMSGPEAEIRVGNALPLRNIPTGTVIHNIELHAGRGGQIVRSAGASAQLMAKEGDYAVVRLPSGEQRLVHLDCMATHRPGGQPRARERDASARPGARATWAAARMCAAR